MLRRYPRSWAVLLFATFLMVLTPLTAMNTQGASEGYITQENGIVQGQGLTNVAQRYLQAAAPGSVRTSGSTISTALTART